MVAYSLEVLVCYSCRRQIWNNLHSIVHAVYMPAPRIPRIIQMTCPDPSDILNPVWRRCLESWRRLHPEYEIRVRGDAEVATFLKTHAPGALRLWNEMPIGAVKADVYRYIVMKVEGGIYADMDCEPLKSIEPLRAVYDVPGGPPPVVLGMELGTEYHADTKSPKSLTYILKDSRWTFKGLCLCQWCMMAAPGSDAMAQASYVAVGGMGRLLNAIRKGKCGAATVMAATGPLAMTRAVLGSEVTRRGVRVISSEYFCAGSYGRVPVTKRSVVQHHFTASWKKDPSLLRNQLGT